ncbi:MAG: hypothetical protein HWN65_11130 [Candidatus Helarchaeota archaeon]|nr:hypothetical protein [Candidatus Helarchaeota archaeon]
MKIDKVVLYVIILFVGYGAILFLPRGYVPIPVAYETGELLWSSISLATLLDLVLASPFLIIMFYYVHKAITVQTSPETPKPSQRKKDIIRFLFFGAAIVMVAGIVMHAIANDIYRLLGIPKDTAPSGNLQVAVYWFDEVLGHKLIHFGIIAFIIGLMVVQYWHRMDSQYTKFQTAGLYFWAVAIGGIYMLATIEGQAGFDVMVISIALIAIILYYMRFKGLKLKENVFTHFVLIFLISMVLTAILYGVIFGLESGYPFFPQPTFI